jgi:hypothetical protein
MAARLAARGAAYNSTLLVPGRLAKFKLRLSILCCTTSYNREACATGPAAFSAARPDGVFHTASACACACAITVSSSAITGWKTPAYRTRPSVW